MVVETIDWATFVAGLEIQWYALSGAIGILITKMYDKWLNASRIEKDAFIKAVQAAVDPDGSRGLSLTFQEALFLVKTGIDVFDGRE